MAAGQVVKIDHIKSRWFRVSVLVLQPGVISYFGKIVKLKIVHEHGDPAEARTLDPQIKSLLLYQLSYGVGCFK